MLLYRQAQTNQDFLARLGTVYRRKMALGSTHHYLIRSPSVTLIEIPVVLAVVLFYIELYSNAAVQTGADQSRLP